MDLTPGQWDAAHTGLSFPLCKVKLSTLQEPEALHDLAPGKDASLFNSLSNHESCSHSRAFALAGSSAQMLTLASYCCSDGAWQ